MSASTSAHRQHIFPSRLDFVHIYPSSPFTVILTHGHNPMGSAYCAESFAPLLRILDKHKLSHLVYYRKFVLENDVVQEISKATDEYKDLVAHLRSLSLKSKDIILVGHSYGGAYAHIFNYLSKSFNVLRSISLDGTDFYLAIPYFIQQAYMIPNISEKDIKYFPTKITYKGRQISIPRIGLSTIDYIMLYKYKDKICKNHFIINYYANERNPKKVLIQSTKDKHYPNLYSLKYSKEYYHSLHSYPVCSKAIFEKFILPLVPK